jgi:hypothetical protein
MLHINGVRVERMEETNGIASLSLALVRIFTLAKM